MTTLHSLSSVISCTIKDRTKRVVYFNLVPRVSHPPYPWSEFDLIVFINGIYSQTK